MRPVQAETPPIEISAWIANSIRASATGWARTVNWRFTGAALEGVATPRSAVTHEAPTRYVRRDFIATTWTT